jgi:hypothetical protein
MTVDLCFLTSITVAFDKGMAGPQGSRGVAVLAISPSFDQSHPSSVMTTGAQIGDFGVTIGDIIIL